jgi:hypothetical protein
MKISVTEPRLTIQLVLIRYILVTYFIFGIIECILNAIIFSLIEIPSTFGGVF